MSGSSKTLHLLLANLIITIIKIKEFFKPAISLKPQIGITKTDMKKFPA